METKQCRRCKKIKSLSDFHIDNSRKDGHTYVCKECSKEHVKEIKEKRKKWEHEWYLKNKDEILARQKKDREENPEKYRERSKKYYESHREERLKAFKEYREKNPGKYREMKREWAWLYKDRKENKGFLKGDGCCLYCGETNPFMLEDHHIFGKDHDFTITLCANHHLPFKRFSKMMENWGEPLF